MRLRVRIADGLLEDVAAVDGFNVRGGQFTRNTAYVANGSYFAPNDTLTREQAATMLARLSDAIGRPLPNIAPTFADNNSISSWAFDATGRVQAGGIMQGVGNNRFDPGGRYTREQSIVTIMRLFDFVR